ncbi:DUF2779 domain-containing protein [Patescibacteria group bacterium]|nr:DUF2779 domain-containing protein [Patescibacteria group bacterium]MBU1907523.1 DUF2779 domain-containing protein [Patescibacteria group bacterium]
MALLTKTDFILYRECPNNVWIKRHKPDEYAKFEVSDFEKSLVVMGNDVERLARGMFPTGYLVGRRSEGAQELTKKLIAERTPVIFQAVFSTDKYLVATDVLKWNESAQKYDIYEIKMSSTEEDDDEGKPKSVNKKRELQYEYDLAFQVNVADECGVSLHKKYLIRLNRAYVRDGELDFTPGQLFIVEDKTEAIERLKSTAAKEMLQSQIYLSAEKMPPAPCPCYYRGRSSHCTAFAFINPHVPTYSVHDLNRIGNSKRYLKELLDEGILEIGDVPIDDRLRPKEPKDLVKPSKPRKLNQILVHRSQEPLVNVESLKAELDSLTFPLYFLDYETYPTAIPPFSGYRPYQQIVFQYSLHVLQDKESEPVHFECLILDGEPSERITESLREHMGDTGTVVSWFKTFENSRNRELADFLPSYKDFFFGIVARTYDLMDIVEGQHYVHPGFEGRSSIKKVLPVLAPHLSYKKLGVQSGTDAIESYRKISRGELMGDAAKEKERQMLEYCKLDTYAMFVLWKFFSELVKEQSL